VDGQLTKFGHKVERECLQLSILFSFQALASSQDSSCLLASTLGKRPLGASPKLSIWSKRGLPSERKSYHTGKASSSRRPSYQEALYALVVIPPADDFLDVRPEQNGMLKLRRVAPFDIAKRWICFHDALLNQMVQTKQVFVLAQSVQISSAPWQSAEVLVDGVE
jgi:hypothetical protein